MKKVKNYIFPFIDGMHPYPFWLFIGFLYSSIVLFGLCGVVMWVPDFLPRLHTREAVAEALFQYANALLAVGGILAPLMDLILHHDAPKK